MTDTVHCKVFNLYYAFKIPAAGRCESFGSYTSFFQERKQGAILGLFSGTTTENCTLCNRKRQFYSGETFFKNTWEITKRKYSARNENVVLETKEIDR